MNTCTAFSADIEDVALGIEPSDALRDHLRTCEACARELDRRRALAMRIDGAVAALVRREPRHAIGSGLTAMPRSSMWRSWAAEPAVWIAAAAVIVAFFFAGRMFAPPPADPTASALVRWKSPTSSLLSPVVGERSYRVRMQTHSTHSHAVLSGDRHVT
jgi:hypothetical protein